MSEENVTENLKGSAKELAGKITDDENLVKEGQAQQEKARERDEAEAKEAEAEEKRMKAAGHEGEQRSRQDEG